MRVAVLGPTLLEGKDGAVDVAGRKTREVLSLLALVAPHPLSVDRLIEALWDEPPPSAVKTVQSHVSRLRNTLAAAGAADALAGSPAGYRIVLPADDLDTLAVDECRRLARERLTAGDAAGAASLLADARRLWRGEPELPSTALGDLERTRLHELQLRLAEDHLAALIEAGEGGDAVVELESLTMAEPLRERLWELRMLALYQSGRQVDVLRAYQEVRELLAEEIGVEPGPALRRLEASILEQSPELAATATPQGLAVEVPHYTVTEGVHLAFGRYGAGGPPLLLLNPGFVPVDSYLDEPHLAAAIRRLGSRWTVVAHDRRGVGLSDPISPTDPPSIETSVEDVVAVLDAAEISTTDVLANADTCLVALQLAVTHPDRVRTMTLVNAYPRYSSSEDYPFGQELAVIEDTRREIHRPEGPPTLDLLTLIAPSVADDVAFRTWWDRVGRVAASPGTALALREVIETTDLRNIVTDVRVPVLLIVRHGSASYDPQHGSWLASHLPDATLIEHESPDDPWWLTGADRVIDELNVFADQHRP